MKDVPFMRRLITCLLFLVLASPAGAGEIRGTCFITFFATSTLHDFTGTVRSKPFTVIFPDKGVGGRIIRRVEVNVPVDEIDTAKEDRDKDMREMFQSDRFPYIHGDVQNIDPDKIRQEIGNSESGETSLPLKLKIRDIEHDIEASVGNLREYGEQISFEMEFPISLKAYGLKPPSLFFGLVKVDDTVTVKVSFDLDANPEKLFSRIIHNE